ncbi:hypothetical protein AB0D08_32925 [Kitasatospora sp. NPDC048540]|uniref:hypothetical protein n=1 Tax=Kitasatospora sp. NPDC048540 TaxID=3155634 RepID=UPI0033C1D6C2
MTYGAWAEKVCAAIDSSADAFRNSTTWEELVHILSESSEFSATDLDEYGFFQMIYDWNLDYLNPVTLERLKWYLNAYCLVLDVPSPWNSTEVENYAGTWFLRVENSWQDASASNNAALAARAPNTYLVGHGGEQDLQISIGDETVIWLYSTSGELLSQLVGAALIDRPAQAPVTRLDKSSGEFPNIQLGPLSDGELAAYVQVAQENSADGQVSWVATDGLPIRFIQEGTALCLDEAFGRANARCTPSRHTCGGVLQIHAGSEIRLITCREPMTFTVKSMMRTTRPEQDDDFIETANDYVESLLRRAKTKPREVVAEIEGLPAKSQALLHSYTALTRFLAIYYVTAASKSVEKGELSPEGFLSYFSQLSSADKESCFEDPTLSAFIMTVGGDGDSPVRAFFRKFVQFGEEGRHQEWGKLDDNNRQLARQFRSVENWVNTTLPMVEQLKLHIKSMAGAYELQNINPFFEAMALGRRIQKNEAPHAETAILNYLMECGLVFAEKNMIDSFLGLSKTDQRTTWESLTPLAKEGIAFQERVKKWRRSF